MTIEKAPKWLYFDVYCKVWHQKRDPFSALRSKKCVFHLFRELKGFISDLEIYSYLITILTLFYQLAPFSLPVLITSWGCWFRLLRMLSQGRKETLHVFIVVLLPPWAVITHWKLILCWCLRICYHGAIPQLWGWFCSIQSYRKREWLKLNLKTLD